NPLPQLRILKCNARRVCPKFHSLGAAPVARRQQLRGSYVRNRLAAVIAARHRIIGCIARTPAGRVHGWIMSRQRRHAPARFLAAKSTLLDACILPVQHPACSAWSRVEPWRRHSCFRPPYSWAPHSPLSRDGWNRHRRRCPGWERCIAPTLPALFSVVFSLVSIFCVFMTWRRQLMTPSPLMDQLRSSPSSCRGHGVRPLVPFLGTRGLTQRRKAQF